jgi:hypothetical protein
MPADMIISPDVAKVEDAVSFKASKGEVSLRRGIAEDAHYLLSRLVGSLLKAKPKRYTTGRLFDRLWMSYQVKSIKPPLYRKTN